MLLGKLHADGTLSDIANREPRQWPDGGTDVPVAAMPTELGPFEYHAQTKRAVPSKEKRKKKDRDRLKDMLNAQTDEGRLLHVLLRLMGKTPADFRAAVDQENGSN